MANVDALIKEFKKNSKENSVVSPITIKDPARLPSGIFQFDLATGGGIPLGRVSVFYGTEASTKTTVSLKLIAQAQKLYPDKKAVLIDIEGHFSADWAQKMGVDIEKLIYIVPDNAEQVVDIVEGLLCADDLSLLVVDSLAAMITQRELESTAEQALVGTAGLIINKLYRKISHALNDARKEGKTPTIILINQIRFKVGVMMGDPETMPGGPSFKFASSMTIRFYGKDVFGKKDDNLPQYKDVSMIIKKWKVPVFARNAEYMLCLVDQPESNLKVGDTYDLKTILNLLKTYDLLVKVTSGQGWQYVHKATGEILTFPTQEALFDKINKDEQFGRELRQYLIKEAMVKGSVMEPE